MIRAVRCDKETFRTVTFESGFNIVLADRTKEATRKDSRNGLGKSTLIEIIHFCLGGKITKQGLGAPQLKDWTFFLDLTVLGKGVTVSRNTKTLKYIEIEGDTSEWPTQPKVDKKSGTRRLRTSQWTDVLGALLFGLDDDNGAYSPTFRSLVAYIIRRGRDAYSTPFESYRKQRDVQTQILNAFLLGLDWRYPQELQVLKDKRTALDTLRDAAAKGLVHDVLGTVGELEAIRVRLDNTVRQSGDELRSFRVHPQYEGIEAEANDLTRSIHTLQNATVSESQLVEYYRQSTQSEATPQADRVAELYAEAGAALPELVRKRLDEVQEFNAKLVENRRRFLQSEIERLERAISHRRDQIRELTEQRANLLSVLSTHRALDEYTRLNERHSHVVAELRDTEQRIARLREVEEGRTDITIKQAQLEQTARADLAERRVQKERAIALFNQNSQALYQAPGKLVIDVTNTGYKFHVEIERSGSQGVENMQVFCYDIMLAQLWATSVPRPDFLIHDSTIFDGVDERQVAQALELGVIEAQRLGFQYICTMNSDAVPTQELSPGFNLDKYVRLRLTDATESGCLLGIRF